MLLNFIYISLIILLFSDHISSIQWYREGTSVEVEAIKECASLMAHYSKDIRKEVFESHGCHINHFFTNKNVDKILKGTTLSANDIHFSFKAPIQFTGFKVHKNWRYGNDIVIPDDRVARELESINTKSSPVPIRPYLFGTSDGKYIVSAISKREFDDFNKGLADYAEHVANTPGSLLIRVVGMFEVNNLYYTSYVAPFPVTSVNNYGLFEFSHANDISYLELEKKGQLPFGFDYWKEFSCQSASLIVGEEGRNFLTAFQRDLVFLRDSKYVNYKFMVGFPLTTTESAQTHPYNTLYTTSIGGKERPLSITLTHFFQRSSEKSALPFIGHHSEKSSALYAEEFDYFRKSQVFYIKGEVKNILKSKKCFIDTENEFEK